MPFLSLVPQLRYEMFPEIRARIRIALQQLETLGIPVNPGDTVAIKVNIVAPLPPEAAACTHPQILRAVILELQQSGCQITVCEDCSPEALSISGIDAVIQETGVAFVSLSNRPYQTVVMNGQCYQYATDILKSDHLISLPKLKTHLYTYYTGAIKNMFGCIPKQQRRELHREMLSESFSQHLVNIFKVKLPSLVIMDGILGMDGIGPTYGAPRHGGLLMLSDDGVLLDYYAASWMGYDPSRIAMIKLALERDLHSDAIEAIEFTASKITDLPPSQYNLIPILEGARRAKYMKMLCGPITVIQERCRKCGICSDSCPYEAIRMRDGAPQVDETLCQLCFCCLELCPHLAIMPRKFFTRN